MNRSPAASLHTGLLVSKGSAQPSRGLALPAGNPPSEQASGSSSIIHALAAATPARTNTATPGRITVRIDERQRLRLRLACAHVGKSRQAIMLDALEHYLTKVIPMFLHDPCACIGSGRGENDKCLQARSE